MLEEEITLCDGQPARLIAARDSFFLAVCGAVCAGRTGLAGTAPSGILFDWRPARPVRAQICSPSVSDG